MTKILLFTALLFTGNFLFAQTKDLAITNWYLPKTKGSLTDSETVRFGIINNGTEDVTTFTVGFSQDGGNTYKEETVTKTITANGGQYTHTFTENFAVVGTDGASYTIMGKVTLAGDEVSTNDEITVTVENRIPGDMGDEPIEITSFPYTDTQEYAFFNDDYMAGFTASNYVQAEDIVYSFTTTESQMYVDAKVTATYSGAGSYPRPSVHLIDKSPDYSFNNRGNGVGDTEALMENAYCYSSQTYYLVVSKWQTILSSYDLEVNLYRQHDFKSFSIESLSAEGVIDYTNRTITVTVPEGTNKTSLTPSFNLPAYTKVWVNGVEQTSGTTAVDFSADVTYSIEQTITPKTTETWTVSVVEDSSTDINEETLSSITIVPNPVQDMINISGTENNSVDQIMIYNASGAEVYKNQSVNQQNLSIPASHLKPGIYFIAIKAANNKIVKKFIKK